jgi:Tetracyclin repressor-like, C-terminal domain
MVHHLGILHRQIDREVEHSADPVAALHLVLILTLRYFQAHLGLIKLFFMQIGYGDPTATVQLRDARQTYRNILESILRSGIAEGIFLDADVLDVQIAIDSIIGTVNWSVYNQSIVRNENIEPDELAEKLTVYLLRELGYASVKPS